MSEDEADSTLVTAFSFCMYMHGSMSSPWTGPAVLAASSPPWEESNRSPSDRLTFPDYTQHLYYFQVSCCHRINFCVVTCGSIWITFQSNFEKCFDSLPSLSVRLHPTFLIPHGLGNLHSSGRAEDLKERCALDPLSCDLKGKALCYFNK